MDEVKLEVELARPLEARAIQAQLRQTLGLRVRIVPLKPGILPAQIGKARRVADLRPPRADAGRGRRADRDGRRSAARAAAPARRSRTRSACTCRPRACARATGSGARRTSPAQFGVSRPTLREALRLLSSSHLIRASKGPGGGIFVAATPEEGIGRTVSASVASMLGPTASRSTS